MTPPPQVLYKYSYQYPGVLRKFLRLFVSYKWLTKLILFTPIVAVCSLSHRILLTFSAASYPTVPEYLCKDYRQIPTHPPISLVCDHFSASDVLVHTRPSMIAKPHPTSIFTPHTLSEHSLIPTITPCSGALVKPPQALGSGQVIMFRHWSNSRAFTIPYRS